MPTPTGFNFSANATATAAQLTSVARTPYSGFTIKVDPAATGTVYFGYTSGVTAGTSAATDGMPLTAGQAYMIPPQAANDVTGIYIISSTGTIKVFVEGC